MALFGLGLLMIGLTHTVFGSQNQVDDILNSVNVSCQSDLTERGIFGCLDTSVLTNITLLTTVIDLLNKEKLLYDVIGNTTNVTKESVLRPILVFQCKSYPIYKSLEFLRLVTSDTFLKMASIQAMNQIDHVHEELRLHQGVVGKFENLVKGASNLTADELRFVEMTIRGAYRDGFNLTNETRVDIHAGFEELRKLETNFTLTIQHNRDKIQFNRSSLRGVPEEIMKRHVKENGTSLTFSVFGADYAGVFGHCEVEESRKEMFKGNSNRGGTSNIEILKKVVEIRTNISRSLGYKNYVDLVTEGMVAGNHTNVKKFMDELHSKLIPGYINETVEFLNLKLQQCWQNETCTNETQIWDFPFLSNVLKKKKFSVNEHKIKEYFPLEYVLNSTLVIFGELLGLKFNLVNLTLWSNDVISYHVTEMDSGETMGYLLLDLKSRPGKSGQSKVITLQSSCLGRNGSRQVPVAAVIHSFVAHQDNPILLNFGNLELLYRLLGNAFYIVSSKTNISAWTTDLVAGDFVKAPSRMMDYWLREHSILGNISSHYQNRTSLPGESIVNITKSTKVGFSVETLKQAMLALYDQSIYVNGTTNPNQDFIDLCQSVLNFTIPSDIMFPSVFFHLVSSYGGKYYSYFWSQIYSADIYLSQFQKYGIRNSTVGKAFRHKILEKGSSQDALTLLKEFLGRDPTPDAFLKINHLN